MRLQRAFPFHPIGRLMGVQNVTGGAEKALAALLTFIQTGGNITVRLFVIYPFAAGKGNAVFHTDCSQLGRTVHTRARQLQRFTDHLQIANVIGQ